jgi:hypothetical protein
LVKPRKIQENPANGHNKVKAHSMEVNVLPVEDKSPRPKESGQGEELHTNSGNQMLGIYEVADRLQLPVREVSWLVAAGHLRYFLFPLGCIRFRWELVLEDLQKFEHTGDPQSLVEAELERYQSPLGPEEAEDLAEHGQEAAVEANDRRDS